MTDKELMQQALDALEIFAYKAEHRRTDEENNNGDKAIKALRARLAQPEPEPVVWMYTSQWKGDERFFTRYQTDLSTYKADKVWPLYTAPPQREWVGLTDENEIKHCWYEACQTDLELTSQLVVYFARHIEAKLKEKNNG